MVEAACGGGPHDDLRHLVCGEVSVVEGERAHTAHTPRYQESRQGREVGPAEIKL